MGVRVGGQRESGTQLVLNAQFNFQGHQDDHSQCQLSQPPLVCVCVGGGGKLNIFWSIRLD